MADLRDPCGPVLAGDRFREGKVRGFGYFPSNSPDSSCDSLLFEGQEQLAEVLFHPVPDSAAEAQSLAPPPASRLRPEHVREAGEINVELSNAVAAVVGAAGKSWTGIAEKLISAVVGTGHSIWIAGGAARDLVSGEVTEVRDLDLAGTMPPGGFTGVARKELRSLGIEFREKVSHDLVCSSTPTAGGDPLFEYRTLNTDAFQFPASGSDLIEDVSTRDFAVNSLFVDPSGGYMLDPSGCGIDDLRATPRRITSINTSADALTQAIKVLRAMKFIQRWAAQPGVAVADVVHWPDGDLAKYLSNVDWDILASVQMEYLDGVTLGTQLILAGVVGSEAEQLLKELSRRKA